MDDDDEDKSLPCQLYFKDVISSKKGNFFNVENFKFQQALSTQHLINY